MGNSLVYIKKHLNLYQAKLSCRCCKERLGRKKLHFVVDWVIVKQKGDYLLALKGNQGNLHEEIKEFLEIAKDANFNNIKYDFHEYVDSGHGRIETRRSYAIDFKKYKKHIPEGLKWKKLIFDNYD